MGTSGERRRAADGRPPQPGFGPTPGAVGPPDPEGFVRTLSAALEGARRARRALTLVRIEVVPRGGADGERELCEVARLVRATVRESDGIWRDGPSSLALLLADTDGPNAEPALARMRLRLRGRVHADVLIGRAAAQPGVSAGVLQELARSDARSISVP